MFKLCSSLKRTSNVLMRWIILGSAVVMFTFGVFQFYMFCSNYADPLPPAMLRTLPACEQRELKQSLASGHWLTQADLYAAQAKCQRNLGELLKHAQAEALTTN